MEINSQLLNDNDFKWVKKSLIEVSEIDGKEEFRTDTVEYINYEADNDDDEFFFDMLIAVRFINPNSDHVAYTTPHKLIYLNCPNKYSIPQWEFIYDHECLHQLWDTFAVGEDIKNNGIEYNHYILNIASDCVINDYLARIRKKQEPGDGITPKYLKDTYNVDYDPTVDTQYTLYLKLLEVKDKLKDDKRAQNAQDEGGEQGQGQGSGGEQGQSNEKNQSKGENQSKGQGQGQGQDQSNGESQDNGNKSDAEQAQDAANKAQGVAQGAQDAANEANKNGDKDAAEKQKAADEAKKAADEAKKAADEAKKAEKKGDKNGAAEAKKKAQEAAKRAMDAAKKAGAKGTEKGKATGKGAGKGDGETDPQFGDEDLDEIEKQLEGIIEKHKKRQFGDLGKFIEKCQASKQLKEAGLAVNAVKGTTWNTKVQQACNAYLKMRLFKAQREFKRTYQKVRRGSGLIKFGQPLQKGKKIKDDKFPINVAFYVDISGSMGGVIQEVFKAAYTIAGVINKTFGREKLISEVIFKMHAFNDDIIEVNWGKTVNCYGGTCPFDDILKYIKENTNEYLINVVITDAEFPNIDESKIEKFLHEVAGCVIFVTNNKDSEIKDIANKDKNKSKLFFVEAESDFNIS